MIQLHWLEWLPIVIYFSGVLLVGFRSSEAPQDDAGFILGGRRLTLPAFVATLVTTWYGGILGVGEYTYLYGISNWIVFGLPYYIFAVCYAIWVAPKIQAAGALSIPAQLQRRYGSAGRYLGAFYIFFMTLPAPYILMVGFLIHLLTGAALWQGIIAGTLISVVYVLNGGFRAVVRTDKLQFLCMFGGFLILLIALVWQYGGPAYLISHLPPLHLTWHGGNDWGLILVWFFIALWTFVDPGFHQRVSATASAEKARKGILISVGFWFCFDLMTTACGLYARVIFSGQEINPVLAFPLLGHEVLPPLLSGIFLTGLLATIMSSVDSFTFISAVTLGHDLFRKSNSISSIAGIRLGLFLTAVVSVGLAILLPSVIDLWLLLGNIFIPPLLLPLLSSYSPKFVLKKAWGMAALVLPFLVSLGFLISAMLSSPSLGELNYPGGILPMYPGLLTSLLIFLIGRE